MRGCRASSTWSTVRWGAVLSTRPSIVRRGWRRMVEPCPVTLERSVGRRAHSAVGASCLWLPAPCGEASSLHRRPGSEPCGWRLAALPRGCRPRLPAPSACTMPGRVGLLGAVGANVRESCARATCPLCAPVGRSAPAGAGTVEGIGAVERAAEGVAGGLGERARGEAVGRAARSRHRAVARPGCRSVLICLGFALPLFNSWLALRGQRRSSL